MRLLGARRSSEGKMGVDALGVPCDKASTHEELEKRMPSMRSYLRSNMDRDDIYGQDTHPAHHAFIWAAVGARYQTPRPRAKSVKGLAAWSGVLRCFGLARTVWDILRRFLRP